MTRDKRFVSSVRGELRRLARYHELTQGQYRKILTNELATDEEILALSRWARGANREFRKHGVKRHPALITAEAVICEKLLGLSHLDGARILFRAKTLDDLRTMTNGAAQERLGRSLHD
jgi:hypothetical protein